MMQVANDDWGAITPYERAWAKQKLPGFEHRHRTRLVGKVHDFYEHADGRQAAIVHHDDSMEVVEAAFTA